MKAILVLDEMPTRCDDCRFSNYGLKVCQAEAKKIKDGGQRQDYCPLKEVPRKRGKMFLTERSQNDTDLMVKSAFANCYTDGWNDCLEEVEGHENA